MIITYHSVMRIENNTFLNNTSHEDKGIFIVNGHCSLNISSTLFINNYWYDVSIMLVTDTLDGLLASDIIIFYKCTFENNTSNYKLMSFLTSTVVINSCKFIDNISQKLTHGISAFSLTNLTISNIEVTFTDQHFWFKILARCI